MTDDASDAWLEAFRDAVADDRVDDALGHLEAALAEDPDLIAALGCKGSLLLELDRAEEALACFERIAELDPESAPAQYHRGVALQGLDRPEEALDAYASATDLDSEDADAWVNRGRLLDDDGRYEDALICYDEALRIEPGDEVAWANRGNSLLHLERFEDALYCYEKALEIEPSSPPARLGRCSALASLGRIDDANEARPSDTDLDRGELRELRHAIDEEQDLVLRYWLGRHTNPEALHEIAAEVLESCAGCAERPPGLADGVRIGYGWSIMTVRAFASPGREGGLGDELVLCEPDFQRDPFEGLTTDISFTLQTIFMTRILHEVVDVEPVGCSMVDAIAVAPGILEERHVLLERRSTTDAESGFSGWFVGPSDSDAFETLDLEGCELIPTAELAKARTHLIKVLSLPAGYRVAFDGHQVVSVLDAQGEERWSLGRDADDEEAGDGE